METESDNPDRSSQRVENAPEENPSTSLDSVVDGSESIFPEESVENLASRPSTAPEALDQRPQAAVPGQPISNPDIEFFAKPVGDVSLPSFSQILKKIAEDTSEGTQVNSDDFARHTPGPEGTGPSPALESIESAAPPLDPNCLARDFYEESPEELLPSYVKCERQPSISGLSKPVLYGIEVPNTGTKPLFQVKVDHELPAGFQFLGAEPTPELRNKRLIWRLGDILPKTSRRIVVRVQPKQAGKLLPESATTFRTTYGIRTRISRPRIQVQVSGPESVPVGDAVSFVLEITNSGTGPAANIQIHNKLSDGLTLDQRNSVKYTLRSLLPGECVKLTLEAKATLPGIQGNEVTVTTAEGIAQSCQATVLATHPELALTFNGPRQLVLNREGDYVLIIANTGTSEAVEVTAKFVLPEGVEFTIPCADEAADPYPQAGTWFIASLRPGESRSFPIRVLARYPGDCTIRAEARAKGLEPAFGALDVVCDFPNDRTSRLLEEMVDAIDFDALRNNAAWELASEDATGTTGTRPEDRYLVFSVGSNDFAIPMANLVEIGRPSRVTPVPNVPNWILGVANIRGDIVSIVELNSLLELAEAEKKTEGRVVVVHSEDEEWVSGLWVDKVKGLRTISPDRIVAPPSTNENRLTRFVLGVTESENRLIIFLDLEAVLHSAESQPVEFA